MKTPILFTILLGLVFSGCATQHTHLEEVSADGSYRESDSVTRTFWDSKNELTKLKTSIGKTQSIGISGLNQETTSTNIPAIISSGGVLIGEAARTFLGAPSVPAQ